MNTSPPYLPNAEPELAYLSTMYTHPPFHLRTSSNLPQDIICFLFLSFPLPSPLPSKIYFCALGPATPAPITLGNSSSPILYSSPTPQLVVAARPMPNTASNQNCTLISFFWHAGPPQYTVFVFPSLSCDTVGLHLHAQQSSILSLSLEDLVWYFR